MQHRRWIALQSTGGMFSHELIPRRGRTVWITGLPAAGKTTLGDALAAHLRSRGERVYRLDGDELRRGLCADLGFDEASRQENIRRAAHVACLMADTGLVVIASLISPYQRDRELARRLHAASGHGFLEVFVDVSLQECERRDPRGLYARARRGQLDGFTGIDAPYEPPTAPDVRIHPGLDSVSECVAAVMAEFDTADVRRSAAA